MEEDAAREGGLRPYSQPLMPSRFPSLRRLNNAEPYRHRLLPADSPGDDERPNSEITFAVFNDDASDYHFGPFSNEASLGSGDRRGSASSLAPSFRTRDSRALSIYHYDSDHIDNQYLLAEGALPPRSPSQQSWCTCDDGDDYYHVFRQDKLRLAEINLEAQIQT
jgi:hypothetical protein